MAGQRRWWTATRVLGLLIMISMVPLAASGGMAGTSAPDDGAQHALDEIGTALDEQDRERFDRHVDLDRVFAALRADLRAGLSPEPEKQDDLGTVLAHGISEVVIASVELMMRTEVDRFFAAEGEEAVALRQTHITRFAVEQIDWRTGEDSTRIANITVRDLEEGGLETMDLVFEQQDDHHRLVAVSEVPDHLVDEGPGD